MMNIRFPLAASISGLFLMIGVVAYTQTTNELLDRDFWKQQPSVEKVKAKIEAGNDPTELNRFAFDPMVWAILEKAPMETLKYLLTLEGNGVNKLTHDERTYIFWAAYKDNLELMQHLIDQGARTDLLDKFGYSLLNFAAVTGQDNPKLYDFIIAHGANVQEEKNADGANALLLLLPHLDDQEMARYFMDKGLSLTSRDSEGNGAFYHTAKGGNVKMLDWLISEGVEYQSFNDKGGNAMMAASQGMRRHSNSVELFRYLDAKGIDANVTTSDGKTPLSAYAYSGKDPKVVAFLLKKGVSPDQVDSEGRTALMNAAEFNAAEMVDPIVSAVEDVNTANKKGQTALTLAVLWNSAEVVGLLVANGAQATVTDGEGNNLLYYLVESYNPRKPEAFDEKRVILTKSGLSLVTPQSNGNTLFHLAAQQNNLSLMKGANELGINVNARNKEGLTALHLAAMKADNEETLKYLIEIGADKGINTAFDESAYQLARENELLRDKEINLEFLAN